MSTKKRALLIGIDYLNTKEQLFGCINDVTNVKTMLLARGYREENILFMTDKTITKPTKTNVFKAFDWLLSDAQAKDFAKSNLPPLTPGTQLVFHYAGHGSFMIDRNNDEPDGRDEILIPIDYTQTGGILDDDIRKYLVDRIPDKSSLRAVVDSCNSKSIFDLAYTLSNPGTKDSNTFVLIREGEYKETQADVILLSAAQDFEDAQDVVDSSGRGSGALTSAYLSVLSDSNYSVPCDTLLKRVRELIERKFKNQTPALSMGRFMPVNTIFSI